MDVSKYQLSFSVHGVLAFYFKNCDHKLHAVHSQSGSQLMPNRKNSGEVIKKCASEK